MSSALAGILAYMSLWVFIIIMIVSEGIKNRRKSKSWI